MDTYIRDYKAINIDTFSTSDQLECKSMLNKTKNETFSVFHKNIRSLGKNFDELQVMLEGFDYCFDCIVLSETWRILNLNQYKLVGYDSIYSEGVLNKCDGIVIYIKSSLTYEYQNIILNNSKTIELTISKHNKKFKILSIYRSPSTCPMAFNIELYNYLKTNNQPSDINIITGDINIDILSENDYCQEYLNILHVNNYISMINKETRIQGISKTCLDHIFLKTKEMYENFRSFVFESTISDHFSVILQYEFEQEKKELFNDKIYKTYIDYNRLKKMFAEKTWLNVYENGNINEATDVFITEISQCISTCTRKLEMKKKEIKKNPWITDGLVSSTNEKNKMYKKVHENPKNQALQAEFKIYRNKLNELIRIAKHEYYKGEIEKNRNCPKNMWRCLKNIESGKHEVGIKEIKVGDDIIRNKKQMTENFNKFFTDIGSNLAKEIKVGKKFQSKRNINSIYMCPTDEPEVEKLIKQLKSNKAPGLDNIGANTLKESVGYIVKPLTYLINKSLENGIFPESLKIAVIKPLHKSGDKRELSNYRPISLLSNISKIFEKIIKSRITGFIKKNNMISEKQYGFMEGRSTQDAIAELTRKIYNALDARKPAICLFVDLAKAFDTVSHPDLLETLENFGFRGSAHRLMTSYLSGRKQCVTLDNEVSSTRVVSFGVPQGTVLGPILFILYVNSLFDLQIPAEITSFADDTVFFFEDNNWENLKQKVVTAFPLIVEFFNSKLLTINFKKTIYLPFTSYEPNLPGYGEINIPINGNTIQIKSSKTVKYLGITLDSNLKWNAHMKNLTQKIRYLVYKFKFLKNILDLKHLKIIYHALVQTHLSYGIIAWGGVTKNHLRNLETVQKWILKIMLNRPYTYPSEDLYKEAEIMDIRQVFALTLLLHQRKNISLAKNIDHKYNTRTRINSIDIPRMLKTIGQRSYSYLAPKLYNDIPFHFKRMNSFSLFKSKIKTWILNTPRTRIHQIIDSKNY